MCTLWTGLNHLIDEAHVALDYFHWFTLAKRQILSGYEVQVFACSAARFQVVAKACTLHENLQQLVKANSPAAIGYHTTLSTSAGSRGPVRVALVANQLLLT